MSSLDLPMISRHTNRPRISFTAALLGGVLCVGALCGQPDRAAAVSLAVQNACMSDYFAYCSRHDVDTPGLRSCMRAAGPKLSRSCVSALVKAGEVPATKTARSDRRRKRSA